MSVADREGVLRRGRSSASALRAFETIEKKVIISIPHTVKELGLSVPTVTAALERLQALEIVRETTGRNYGRQYVYARQLEILNRDDDTAM